MKKILFLIIAVALTAFNTAAQDSKLLGKWEMSTTNLGTKGITALNEMSFEFSSDKTGNFLLSGIIMEKMPDEKYSMYMIAKFTSNFTWNLTDNSLGLEFKTVDLRVEDFTITPESSETKLIAAMMQAAITKELNKNKESLQTEFLNELGVLENKVEIIFIDNDTFKLKDEEGVIFKRIK